MLGLKLIHVGKMGPMEATVKNMGKWVTRIQSTYNTTKYNNNQYPLPWFWTRVLIAYQ